MAIFINQQYRNTISLLIWMIIVFSIGFIIGSLTKSQISTWYETLNKSPLTPPNSIFPLVWSILYVILAICGWKLWMDSKEHDIMTAKILYIIQLGLNWSWTPLFFQYHLTGISLLVLVMMDLLTSLIIFFIYPRIKILAFLMLPYLIWILLATYLNFYIWQHN
ncbi:MAG: TspO/MBR family protein [Rhabdochlamydiaceae bacterium]